jgi:predicted nucleic acid-binding protein
MILVDSSVWIFHFRNAERPSTALLQEQAAIANVLVGDVILLEILRGARDDRHSAFLEAQLRRFPVVSLMSDRLVSAAATNYRRLRAQGITIRSLADLIIGTYCIEHGHMLLHDDRGFTPMVEHLGLRLA